MYLFVGDLHRRRAGGILKDIADSWVSRMYVTTKYIYHEWCCIGMELKPELKMFSMRLPVSLLDEVAEYVDRTTFRTRTHFFEAAVKKELDRLAGEKSK